MEKLFLHPHLLTSLWLSVPNGIPPRIPQRGRSGGQATATELRSLPFQELDLFKALPKHGWFPPSGGMDERESTNNSFLSKKGSVSAGQPISGA